jgi:hypothetical protein
LPNTLRGNRDLSRGRSGEVGGEGYCTGIFDRLGGGAIDVGSRFDPARLRSLEEGEEEGRDLSAALRPSAVMVFAADHEAKQRSPQDGLRQGVTNIAFGSMSIATGDRFKVKIAALIEAQRLTLKLDLLRRGTFLRPAVFEQTQTAPRELTLRLSGC